MEQHSAACLGGVVGARLCGASTFEVNGRGSDYPESVSVTGNWRPRHLSDVGKRYAIETAPLCRGMMRMPPVFSFNP